MPLYLQRRSVSNGAVLDIEETIDIAVSPSAVSDVLLDVEAAPLWTAGLERLEVVEGHVGEPGCVGRAHYVQGSRRYVVEDRLVEAVPGHRFKSEIRGGGIKATIETSLNGIPSGTRMTIRWIGGGTNPLTKLVLTFLGRQVGKRTREDMQALRDLAERRGEQYEGSETSS